MKYRHATPLALAAFGFLAACGGGGDATTEGGGAPETVPETALFSAEMASRLQMLTNAGPPEEITDEEAESRDEQDRMGGQNSWLDSDPTDERHSDLRELAYEHWEDAWTGGKWHGILAKDGLALQGNRAESDRALLVNMDHVEFYVFTTDALGGGISSGAWGVPSGSAPNERATWQGLMIGAANDGLDLLQGDATVMFHFGTSMVDVNFTNIVNLDRMAEHSVPADSFTGVPVSADGIWERGDNGSDRHIIGGFAGPGHEEAAGRFWTLDMTGSFGAARQ